MIDEEEISNNQQQKRFPRHLIFINLCDWQDSSISDWLSFIIIKSFILKKLIFFFFSIDERIKDNLGGNVLHQLM